MRRVYFTLLLSVLLVATTLAGQPASTAALDELEGKDAPVILRFEEIELSKIIEAVGKAVGFDAVFADGYKDYRVTVDWKSLTAKEALTKLSVEHGLSYEVPAPDRLVVANMKQRQTTP